MAHQRFRVWVNGREIENVLEADTEVGRVMALNADGGLVVHRGLLRILVVGRP